MTNLEYPTGMAGSSPTACRKRLVTLSKRERNFGTSTEPPLRHQAYYRRSQNRTASSSVMDGLHVRQFNKRIAQSKMQPSTGTDAAGSQPYQLNRNRLGVNWLTKIDRVLQQLARLQDGWDTYSAPAPNQGAIARARLFLPSLHAECLPPSRIAPSTVGGVGITFRREKARAYIEFRNDSLCYLLLAYMPNEPLIQPIRCDDSSFRDAIQMIRGHLDGRA